MEANHTIWTATQELDIDNLRAGRFGRVVNVLDMVSSGDSFLQTPCTIIDGTIYIGSVAYENADDPQTGENKMKTKAMMNSERAKDLINRAIKGEKGIDSLSLLEFAINRLCEAYAIELRAEGYNGDLRPMAKQEIWDRAEGLFKA